MQVNETENKGMKSSTLKGERIAIEKVFVFCVERRRAAAVRVRLEENSDRAIWRGR